MNARIPSKPGNYYWSEWKCVVEVKQRGQQLYVTPPNGVEVKITAKIAGRFVEQS